MDDLTITLILSVSLVLLFFLSAFFSGSETALMSLDRYKLRHTAKRNKSARMAQRLLEKPDRLIGLILLGNNFVNILITQLATFLGFHLGGNPGVAIATGLLALMLLIFAELAPKTLAAVKSETLAYPAARIYTPLLKFASPIVWMANQVANALLRRLGVDPETIEQHTVGRDELRTIVRESESLIPGNHQKILLRVLDLESTTVEDIMIPRQEIAGIDLNDDWDVIEKDIARSPFTRLLVYRENADQIMGFVHLRKLIPYFKGNNLDKKSLERAIRPNVFTLESTPLTQQLINFQNDQHRIALVVDEYGEIQGLITLEDILEEIVGQFSTDPASISNEIIFKEDGRIIADGGMHIRDVNRQASIHLPTSEAKTLNGLVVEHLESMPVAGLSILINNYPIEIRKVKNNAVKSLIIYPQLNRPSTYD